MRVNYSSPNLEFNSRAVISCIPGYNIQGNSVRTCDHNGIWTGSQSTCDSKELLINYSRIKIEIFPWYCYSKTIEQLKNALIHSNIF